MHHLFGRMPRWAILAIFSLCSAAAQPIGSEKVIIRTPKPYAGLVSFIQSNGGKVTNQYKYVDAIAAEVPRAILGALSARTGESAITKDLEVPAPASVTDRIVRSGLPRTGDENNIVADAATALNASAIQSLAAANPNAYIYNNAINGTAALHGSGITGAGVLVAVIDSGIRPGFPHISLDGSVVGCEDFVGDAYGCSNSANSGHGTFVAGMISANVGFTFSAGSAFREAVLAECPLCFSNPPTNTVIPMVGTAPLSSIYALRVFGPTGGAPTSRILAAVERVIELRELYDAGSGGAKIDVLNMSLGGPNLFPGRDVEDTLVASLFSKGIVPVVSAGNAGPSSATVGSPGTANAVLTVGAASLAHNERILRRLLLGPVNGPLFRPFLGAQTAYFSSRGPNADGRTDPDVTANGFANYGQGGGSAPGTVTLAGGTSFSAPSVAGVAALLRQAFPAATAAQIRNAIVMSANPSLLADGSTVFDQGAGYVDALAARNLLASGVVPNTLPALNKANKNVKVNIEQSTGKTVFESNFTDSYNLLKPGQRHEIFYMVTPNTSQLLIQLSNFTASLPPAQQNQLFGDDVLLTIHTAKTSSIGQGDYVHSALVRNGAFVVNNPETGIMRITVSGDWTNAGTVSGQVSLTALATAIPGLTTQGKIVQAQAVAIPVNVPTGTALAKFRLSWREDWSRFPLNDLDMVLVPPSGPEIYSGATLNNPESVTRTNPTPGTWIAVILGFEVNTSDEKYEFRAELDGKVVK